jgi:hypothetical protein
MVLQWTFIAHVSLQNAATLVKLRNVALAVSNLLVAGVITASFVSFLLGGLTSVYTYVVASTQAVFAVSFFVYLYIIGRAKPQEARAEWHESKATSCTVQTSGVVLAITFVAKAILSVLAVSMARATFGGKTTTSAVLTVLYLTVDLISLFVLLDVYAPAMIVAMATGSDDLHGRDLAQLSERREGDIEMVVLPVASASGLAINPRAAGSLSSIPDSMEPGAVAKKRKKSVRLEGEEELEEQAAVLTHVARPKVARKGKGKGHRKSRSKHFTPIYS